MKIKYFFIFIFILLVIGSIGSISAIDVNSSTFTEDIASNQFNIDNNIDLELTNDEPIFSQVDNINGVSQPEDSREIYVGQNITENGGNGSYENPFSTLDLACKNVSGEDKVTVNIFNGTYYIGSELKFNTNNLFIQGINGKVVIKNMYDQTKAKQSFGLTSSSANFTISNIIFDASQWSKGYSTRQWFVAFYGNANIGTFINCTFTGKTYATGVKKEFNVNYINCTFNYYGMNKLFYNTLGDKLDITYCIINNCIFLLPDVEMISSSIYSNKNITLNNIWFGQNSIPDYMKGISGLDSTGSRIDPIDISVEQYAIFSFSENYMGNNQYEIIGKLCWNGTNDTVGTTFNFSPMTVNLTSATGEIVSSVTLENGMFRVVYTSNSSDNTVTAKLDYETIDLNFTNVDINLDAPGIYYGDDQKIAITLPQATNSTINITVNNKTYELKVNDSSLATFTVPEVLKEGKYAVEVVLNDVENHIYGVNSTELVVSKVGDYTFTSIVPTDAKVDDTVTINVELPSDATGTVIVSVGDNNFSADASANVEINITGLVAGDNNIIVTYSGDDKYVNKSSESILTAEKVELDITNETLNVETPEGTVNPEFSIALPNDATGNLTVIVNNKTYTQELVNGSAKITVDDLTPGDYNATVTYTGDDKYDVITTTTNLTVPKVNVPINNNTLVTDTPKGTTTPEFSIALPNDATGNLTVTINGKNYTQELVNGSAKVTIPNLTPGDYNATITYSGDDKYDPIVSNIAVSVPKPVLTAKNFSMLYTSGTKYTVQVKVDGKAVTGKIVNFVINGKKTTAKTDKNGYASVKITLPPKSKAYKVTANYLGVKVTNKVTVKSIVVAKNLKAKKSAKTLKIKVTLKKVNKKFLNGKKVTLKFNGKTYKVKTNKKGVATFTIKKNVLSKLKVGKKYSYKVFYGKDVVSKKITVKK